MKKRKNIVHYVTRQYMYRNKKRTFTTFIGIVFMVLLMTCVFVGKDTAIQYLQDMASAKLGKWNASVSDVTGKEQEEIQRLPYISSLSSSATLGMSDFTQSSNKERPYLNVKAYETECFDWYNIQTVSGRLPKSPDEIVLSEACLKDGSAVQIGDTIQANFFNRSITGIQKDGTKSTVFPFFQLEIKKGETIVPPQNFFYTSEAMGFQENKEYTDHRQNYTIVGFIQTPNYESDTAAAYTGLTLFDSTGMHTADTINLTMLFDLEAGSFPYKKDLCRIAGEDKVEFNDYVLTFSGNSPDSTLNLLIKLMTVFFVALIVFASVILIYNVFNLSFQERCQYLGMLSSIGATAWQKRDSIYYEAFYLLLPALPFGILSGFGVIYAGMHLLLPYIKKFLYLFGLEEPIPVTLSISGNAIGLTICLSVITVLLSAFLPARKIGKIGAVESIRGNENKKAKPHPINYKAIRRYGPEGLLAGSVLKQQRRKKKGISLSIVIFMVILLVTSFGSKAIHMVAKNKLNGSSASSHIKENEGILTYFPQSSSDLDMLSRKEYLERRRGYDTLIGELSENPYVEHIGRQYEAMFVGEMESAALSKEYWATYYDVVNQYYNGKLSWKTFKQDYQKEGHNPINIVAVDDEMLQDLSEKTGADYECLTTQNRMGAILINSASLSTDAISVWEKHPARYRYYDISQITDRRPGDHFKASFYSDQKEKMEDINFEIAGFATNKQLADFMTVNGHEVWMIVSIETAKKIVKTMGDYEIGQILSESVRIRVEKGHADELDPFYAFSEGDGDILYMGAKTSDMEETMASALVNISDVMLICFVLLTSVICLLNLGNSIGGRMAGRRKEFATLQSVGMTKRQIQKMLLFECAGILAEGLMISAPLSFSLILLIRHVLSNLFGYLYLDLPYSLMLLSIFFTAAAVIMMTLHSYQNRKNQNLLEEIRNESV